MTPAVFVIDTNVLASGLITRNRLSPVVKLVDAMLSGRLVYLLSPALLDEYRTVLLRPKLGRMHGLSEQGIDILLTDIVANAIWREPAPASLAPDPGDNHLWTLLASHPGSVLITGDRLLIEHPPERASVISPRTCAEHFLSNASRAE